MYKTCAFLMSLFVSTTAYSKTTVEIISRYDAHITSAIVASEVVSLMNSYQNTYEFRLTTLPGASGENADQRAIALARSGQNVLVFGSSSTYGFNRYQFGNTFDRDRDLIPLIGLTGTPIAIQVNPKKYSTFEQFIETIRKKPEAFHASTVSNSNTKFFDAIFRERYGLTNVKQLSYRLSSDLIRSVLGDESDYAIYNYADSVGLKLLVVSTDERTEKFPEVPTGKEVGFSDFRFNTLNMFSVPKERLEFGEKLIPLMNKACDSKEVQALIEKTPTIKFCYSGEQVRNKVREEISLIEKYKHLLEFGPKRPNN